MLRHLELMQLQCPVLSNSQRLNFWPEIWYPSSTESWVFSWKRFAFSMISETIILEIHPIFHEKTHDYFMGGRVDFVCIVSRRTKTCDSCCSTSHYLVQQKSHWLPTVAMKVIHKFLYQRGALSVRPLFLHESVMSE